MIAHAERRSDMDHFFIEKQKTTQYPSKENKNNSTELYVLYTQNVSVKKVCFEYFLCIKIKTKRKGQLE